MSDAMVNEVRLRRAISGLQMVISSVRAGVDDYGPALTLLYREASDVEPQRFKDLIIEEGLMLNLALLRALDRLTGQGWDQILEDLAEQPFSQA